MNLQRRSTQLASEPTNQPGEHTAPVDVTVALTEAADYLNAGGRWSLALIMYVDVWLGRMLEQRQ